jgi:Skp family chaperone for outer membrane proteins
MKKITLLLASCLFFTLGAAHFSFAQSNEDRAKKMTDNMNVQLTLSEEQYPKVLKINQDFTDEIAGLKNESSKLTKAKIMKSASNTRNKALKEVLSAEQYAKFEDMQQENRDKLREYYKNNNK